MAAASSLLSTPSTSSSLLARVRRHDGAAWSRFCQLYGPLVYRWGRQAGLQDSDAADIVQEVFRAVATGIASFRDDRPGDTFRGWLWGITRNKLGDHFRRRASAPLAAGGTDAHEQLGQVPEVLDPSESLPAADAGLVRRALELVRLEFEERTWQAFWRAAVDGQAARDIAADLGMTPRAVRQAKYRVLRRLREELV
jgi:RNA polymerase sigma-70 factor (ECF subfamily)